MRNIVEKSEFIKKPCLCSPVCDCGGKTRLVIVIRKQGKLNKSNELKQLDLLKLMQLPSMSMNISFGPAETEHLPPGTTSGSFTSCCRFSPSMLSSEIHPRPVCFRLLPYLTCVSWRDLWPFQYANVSGAIFLIKNCAQPYLRPCGVSLCCGFLLSSLFHSGSYHRERFCISNLSPTGFLWQVK